MGGRERVCVGVSEGESVRMCDAVPLLEDRGASVYLRVNEGAGAGISPPSSGISPPSSESSASVPVLALVLGLVLVSVLLGLVFSVLAIGWVNRLMFMIRFSFRFRFSFWGSIKVRITVTFRVR